MSLNVLAKAVKDGDLKIVYAFMNNITAKNINNALISANESGLLEVAHSLLSDGTEADVNSRADDGSTALMWACKEGVLDIAQYLIFRKADVYAKDNYGWTALMSACKGGHLEVVDYLIAEGVDVNAKDNRGMTALMVACQEGHLDIAKFLIRREADVNAKNNDKQNAELMAKQAGHTEIVEYLKAKKLESKRILLRWLNIVHSSLDLDLPTMVDSNQTIDNSTAESYFCHDKSNNTDTMTCRDATDREDLSSIVGSRQRTDIELTNVIQEFRKENIRGDGQIVERFLGYRRADELETEIKNALKKIQL